MFNDIKIGPLTLHMYGFFIGLGFLSALIISSYRAKKKDLSEDIVLGIVYCAVIGGMLGCRLLFYITEIPNIIHDPSILWDFKNGYVVYGGIIGGIITSMVYCRMKKVIFLDYFDLVAPTISFAQCLGRIGCFCAGCCYGKPTDAWYGITFKSSNYAPNHIKLVPTQLISSIGDFIIFAILMLYSSTKPKRGRTAAMYIMLYGIGRFLVEFLRYDYRGSVGPLSTSQIISIAMVVIGRVMYGVAGKRDSGEISETSETSETNDTNDISENSEVATEEN